MMMLLDTDDVIYVSYGVETLLFDDECARCLPRDISDTDERMIACIETTRL